MTARNAAILPAPEGMAMRVLSSIFIALMAAAFGLLTAGHEAPALAAGTDPIIVLSTISTDSQFEFPLDQPPTSVHLGYGLPAPPSSSEYLDVIFAENEILPSTIPQSFSAYTTQESNAAALIRDLGVSQPRYSFFGMIYWYRPTSRTLV
jgi:hypothetical protein